jgi:hypothetical protein
LFIYRLKASIYPKPEGQIVPTFAGGACVLMVFVGMYATLGMSMPSERFVHAQGRTVIPKIEPPGRGGSLWSFPPRNSRAIPL